MFRDPLIDDLIAANRAKARPGMAQPDLKKMADVGRRRWCEVVEGSIASAFRQVTTAPVPEPDREFSVMLGDGWPRSAGRVN